MMLRIRNWLGFVIIHVAFMGVWGALIEIPEKNGFPPTLGYIVWALTMVPAAIIALINNKCKLDYDKRSVLLGCLAGFLGATGQLVLFFTLKKAPAYLVFPLLSLTPVVTILLAVIFLKEKTGRLGWLGIGIAFIAILLLSFQPTGEKGFSGYIWMLLSAIPLLAWGAIEKSTGREFIYLNHVLKFRAIGIRGPWASEGIEHNFGLDLVPGPSRCDLGGLGQNDNLLKFLIL